MTGIARGLSRRRHNPFYLLQQALTEQGSHIRSRAKQQVAEPGAASVGKYRASQVGITGRESCGGLWRFVRDGMALTLIEVGAQTNAKKRVTEGDPSGCTSLGGSLAGSLRSAGSLGLGGDSILPARTGPEKDSARGSADSAWGQGWTTRTWR